MKKISQSFFGKVLLLSFIAVISLLPACSLLPDELMGDAEDDIDQQIIELISQSASSNAPSVYLNEIPPYSESPYIALNNNIPEFGEEDFVTESFEYYGPLDDLGRCTIAVANVGTDLIPTEKREGISQIKPTGWQSAEYDWIDGRFLYNRCHLIGFQLTGENANENNLITGTRYLNVQGMLPFENLIADYVKETGNHVLYRVTPIFQENNLVADGVHMEGMSVEDKGEAILFNVFAYNVQPGIEIDYATGQNWENSNVGDAANDNPSGAPKGNSPELFSENDVERDYILNINSRKFHNPDCTGASSISEKNREFFTGTRSQLIDKGYEPCGKCKP